MINNSVIRITVIFLLLIAFSCTASTPNLIVDGKISKIVIYYIGWENNYISVPTDGQLRSESPSVLTDYNKVGNLDTFFSELKKLKCIKINKINNSAISSPGMLIDLYSKSNIIATMLLSKHNLIVKMPKGNGLSCKYGPDLVESIIIPKPNQWGQSH